MSLFFKNKKIWVIGGSRGIGLGLAKEMARRGAKVIVSARRDAVEKFPHEFIPLDVTDRKKLKSLCEKMDVDGVVYSSGILEPNYVSDMDEEHLQELIDINILPVALLASYMGKKIEKRRGFFVLMGSVAGVVGVPLSQPYAGGKDFVKNFAESVAVEFPKMTTHLVTPGYVRTEMISGNNFGMPMVYSVRKAVDIITFGIVRKKFHIVFPLPVYIGMWVIRLAPVFIRRQFWKYFAKHIVKPKKPVKKK
ncbi:MAG: SDR family NAD(P)-dependent oxidoreductase [Hydrotalea sp.]|nr:SDR family NAD(P)-dependent oxidoreductase [Hydrotalea sp.]